MSKDLSVGGPGLDAGHLEDLKLAASKMKGPARRAFYAEMVLKYCRGIPWRGKKRFGWNRHTITLGLHVKRNGMTGKSCNLSRPA